MKRFEISLIQRTDYKLLSIDKVEGDTITEVLAQFILIIGGMYDKSEERKLELRRLVGDDDIPF